MAKEVTLRFRATKSFKKRIESVGKKRGGIASSVIMTEAVCWFIEQEEKRLGITNAAHSAQ